MQPPRPQEPVYYVIAGLSLILIAGIIWGIAMESRPGGSVPELRLAPPAPLRNAIATRNAPLQVEYQVGGSTQSANLNYSNETEDGEQHEDVTIPWSKTFPVVRGQFLYLSAQNGQDYGTVTCAITINNITVKRAESSGAYTIATCSTSAE